MTGKILKKSCLALVLVSNFLVCSAAFGVISDVQKSAVKNLATLLKEMDEKWEIKQNPWRHLIKDEFSKFIHYSGTWKNRLAQLESQWKKGDHDIEDVLETLHADMKQEDRELWGIKIQKMVAPIVDKKTSFGKDAFEEIRMAKNVAKDVLKTLTKQMKKEFSDNQQAQKTLEPLIDGHEELIKATYYSLVDWKKQGNWKRFLDDLEQSKSLLWQELLELYQKRREEKKKALEEKQEKVAKKIVKIEKRLRKEKKYKRIVRRLKRLVLQVLWSIASQYEQNPLIDSEERKKIFNDFQTKMKKISRKDLQRFIGALKFDALSDFETFVKGHSPLHKLIELWNVIGKIRNKAREKAGIKIWFIERLFSARSKKVRDEWKKIVGEDYFIYRRDVLKKYKNYLDWKDENNLNVLELAQEKKNSQAIEAILNIQPDLKEN